MKVGIYTDTYFPQVSGVATSVKTLKHELENRGHDVYIFTTTDPKAFKYEEDIIRLPSIPFAYFKDRRVIVRGVKNAYEDAVDLGLDIIHTQTEFGAGHLGKYTGKQLGIPVVHTYHTMYEDYLHYIAHGKILRPSHVKQYVRVYCRHLSGVICPSDRVVSSLKGYNIPIPMEVIPTGVDISKFAVGGPDVSVVNLRQEYSIPNDQTILLSLSRLSYEKNIQAVIKGFAKIHEELPSTVLIVTGEGPYRETLEELTEELNLTSSVIFTGEVSNDLVSSYYKEADYFVSASSSESQGLTYIEAMASGTQCIVKGNEYLNGLFNYPSLGVTYENDEDFANAFLSYAENKVKHDPVVQSNKLEAISSKRFGERVDEFYQQAIEYYQTIYSKKQINGKVKSMRLYKRT